MKKNILFKLLIIIMLLIVFSILISDNCLGVTSAVKSNKTRVNDIKIQEIADNNEDVKMTGRSINAYIGAILTVVSMLLPTIMVIIFLCNIVKYISLKKNNYNEIAELKKAKFKVRLSSIFLTVSFLVSGMIQITKNFKPIIYLYPEKEQKVKVKLKNKEKLTCTYPKYKDGWEVIAKPNGDLVDCETGRNLYALYWEGKNTVKHNLKEGFIVKGEDSIKFLEEKLGILGLNEREAEEFIVYWLPKLESNNYNFIRFETMEEIENDMPLEIEPKPDTVIRVMMVFKGLRMPLEVIEQELETPERKGFTVVEWGGTEI